MKPRFVTLLCGLALAACHDPSRPDPAGFRLEVVAGDGQTAAVGESLADSLVVRVTDRRGSPVARATVGWSLAAPDGGALRSAETRTDADGRTSNHWILGTRAGSFAVEARVADAGGTAADTARATALAGAPARVSFRGDTARLLRVGDTLRVALEGTDRYGNPLPATRLARLWRSADPAVARVDSTGLVAGAGAGRTSLVAGAGTDTVRLRLLVYATTSAVFRMSMRPEQVSGEGSRLFAVGTYGTRSGRIGELFHFTGTEWRHAEYVSSPGFTGTGLRVAPDGTAWVQAPRGGVQRQAPGSTTWEVFSGPLVERLAGAGTDLFQLVNVSSSGPPTPGVLRGAGAGAVNLAAPLHFPDSAFVGTLVAPGPGELYLGGRVRRSSDGRSRPILLYWNGVSWRDVALPAGQAREGRFVASLGAGGGAAYAVVATVALDSGMVVSLSRGVATVLPDPLSARGQAPVGVAADRRGEPYVVHAGGLAWRTPEGWREHPLAAGRPATGTVHVEGDGTVWLAACRPQEPPPNDFPDCDLVRVRSTP